MSSPFAPVNEQRTAAGRGAILFDAARLPQGEPALLDAARWPQAAGRGRGGVRRVEGPFGSGVLRHYRRGGAIAHLLGDRYLWTGEDQTRAFREFRLLAKLRASGLPAPAPLAAGYARSGPWYRADLLTEEVPGARTLADSLDDARADVDAWRALGATLARFHAAGVCHADLNAHNLLRDRDGAWWLIDFDRGDLRPPGAWIDARLARLQRSLAKLGAERQPGHVDAWQALLSAHAEGLARA